MTTIIATAPAGYVDADEGPATSFPSVPLWTENYCNMAYDAERQVGLWLHLSRQNYDPTLWREIAIVYLPSGQRVVTKNYGRSESPRGPGAATLHFEYIEPWNLWTTTLDGAGIRTTEQAMQDRAVPDGLHEQMRLRLDWQALTPIWDMGAQMREQSWGHTHYEQLCRVRGQIDLGATSVQFDGTGIRDHTRGPRDYGEAQHHIWAHGVFPSGRCFIVIDVVGVHNRICRAVLFEDGKFTEVEPGEQPMLSAREQGSQPYELSLGGTRISGEVLHNTPLGLVDTNDVLLGFDAAHATHCLFEGMSRFTWDGETGYGLTERLLKLKP